MVAVSGKSCSAACSSRVWVVEALNQASQCLFESRLDQRGVVGNSKQVIGLVSVRVRLEFQQRRTRGIVEDGL